MLRSLHLDTVRIPRSFILDTLDSNAQGIPVAELKSARHVIDVWAPDANDNVSYEDLVFLLGQKGHGQVAQRLIETFGPTESVLRLPGRPGETWVEPTLYWPGPVQCDSDLVISRGAVGGEIRVLGSLTFNDLAAASRIEATSLLPAAGRDVVRIAAKEAEPSTPTYHVKDLELPGPQDHLGSEIGMSYLRNALQGSALRKEPVPQSDIDDGFAPR